MTERKLGKSRVGISRDYNAPESLMALLGSLGG
jgi:hypothetical protein